MRDRMIDLVNGALKEQFDYVPLNKAIRVSDELLANGVLLPAAENFIFHDGCLARQDFYRLVGACKDIGAMIWDAPACGFTENGVDYLPVNIMLEPEEIETALRIILSFLQPGKQEHAQPSKKPQNEVKE